MNSIFRLFCISFAFLLLAWIAKMHFIFGGDYLFRTASIGILLALLIQLIGFSKNTDLQKNRLTRLFALNSIGLFIAHLGIMMKVSHLMGSQFEKDFVLDFIGIPAVLVSAIHTFGSAGKLLEASRALQALFLRHAVFPWLMFLFSFMLYALYSVLLTRI